MNPRSSPSFYPIEPLLPWLQAGVPVLTPNQRLARQIKLAWGLHLQAQGVLGWETPAVYSLEQWWQLSLERLDPWQESGLSLASEAQQLHLWQQCIEENPDSGALLRPRAAAALARDAHRSLQLWQVEWQREPIIGAFREHADTVLFEQWALAFEQKLKSLGLMTLPQMLAQQSQLPHCDALVLVEFNELSPLYKKALEAQASKLHHHCQQTHPERRQLQPCTSPEQEMVLAAQWAHQSWQANPDSRIGVLLPDMQGQRQALQRQLCRAFGLPLSRAGELPINFSGGIPLASAPPVSDAIQLLDLVQGDIDVAGLCLLLHSRYYGRDADSVIVPVLRRLYRRGRAAISAGQWRYMARDLRLGGALLGLHGSRELKQKHRLARWVTLLQSSLAELGWPGAGPLDSDEFQQIEQFYVALEGLTELDAITGVVDFSSALTLLRQALTGRLYQRQTPSTSIQVLGLLEAAGLVFDKVWLVGMGGMQWPAAPSPNPFIPVPLQRQREMPHADARREREFAQRLMQQFESCNAEICASYVAQEGGIALRPSALLQHFESLPAVPEIRTPELWQEQPPLTLERLESEVQAPAVDAVEAAQIRGGSGLLADQSQCEFRAFANHRLHVRPLSDLSIGLTASDRGSLLHDALFQLWGEIGDSQVLAATDEAARAALCKTASAAAITRFAEQQTMIGHRYLELEQTRLSAMLQRWLEIESQREGFTVEARESEVSLVLQTLNLSLRIDRVDRLQDNSLLVVDYKSGDNKPKDWFGERPRQPQLPLYAQALGDELGGIAFAMPPLEEVGYRGIATQEQGAGIEGDLTAATKNLELAPQNWEEARQHWHEVLTRLATEFLAGHAAVNPLNTNDSCRYCGLQALCRIGQVVADD
ncbi:PD-(D/E)XK nuclease family protein [Candidatus Litorirhabdus singularis]|uniref:PD-(D/E)XK nuclease family protein n=1 Tax=Candidatus Litorirhabdus singularis TaxID=2518993 RepID=UPI002430E6A0|nr:PD-(D/E)XK nuclease family protein [Candidatus Litorirhabdus singularis]